MQARKRRTGARESAPFWPQPSKPCTPPHLYLGGGSSCQAAQLSYDNTAATAPTAVSAATAVTAVIAATAYAAVSAATDPI